MRSGNGGMGEDEEGGRRGRREGRERDLSEMIVLGIVGFMMVPFSPYTKATIVCRTLRCEHSRDSDGWICRVKLRVHIADSWLAS